MGSPQTRISKAPAGHVSPSTFGSHADAAGYCSSKGARLCELNEIERGGYKTIDNCIRTYDKYTVQAYLSILYRLGGRAEPQADAATKLRLAAGDMLSRRFRKSPAACCADAMTSSQFERSTLIYDDECSAQDAA